jgi:DNA polymerase-3 subunit beta
MNIQVLQENLHKVIQDLQKAIPSRPSLPILGCILLKTTSERTIQLSVTDLNMGILVTMDAQVIEPGEIAIPAKVFIDYISSLRAGEISLQLSGHQLSLKSSTSNATIPCLEAQDYPSFPEKDGDEIKFSADVLLPALQHISFTASVDEARPALTSILFSFTETLEMVATDGFRLAVEKISSFEKTSQLQTLLIPAKALQEVLRIATRKKVETISFQVSERLKQVFFSLGDVEILVRLMEADFPPYQKIIPSSFATTIVFDGEEFSQLLKTAMIFARESSGIIRFKIEENSLTLISASSALGQQESTVPILQKEGPDQEIAFNARYLSEFLSVLKPEKIWLGMNESLKPAVLRPEGMNSLQYIVMPFRVNQ